MSPPVRRLAAVLLVGSSFIAMHDPASAQKVPTFTFEGREIGVLPFDVPGRFTWAQAVEACRSLNQLGFDDWRLPSDLELHALYDVRDQIGEFSDGKYWSSREIYQNYAWSMHFVGEYDTGPTPKHRDFDPSYGPMRARCVRNHT